MLIYIPKFEINLVSKKSDSNVWDLCIYIVYLWLDLRKKNVLYAVSKSTCSKDSAGFPNTFNFYFISCFVVVLSFVLFKCSSRNTHSKPIIITNSLLSNLFNQLCSPTA